MVRGVASGRSEIPSDERAARIAEKFWRGQECAIERLSGGMTNANYKVSVAGDGQYVIRLFGNRTELLGVNREAEKMAASLAASLGIGPKLVEDCADEGALVLEFICGASVPHEDMIEPDTLARVTDALRKLHSGSPLSSHVDPLRVAERNYSIAERYGVTEQQVVEYSWAHDVAGRIESAVGFRMSCPCHCDLMPGNFLDDGEIRIIDWEYAGMSDPRFDLANLSSNMGFSIDDDILMIESYFGREDILHLATIRLLRFVSAFREVTWSYAQQHISDIEFDFFAFNREYYERLRQEVEEFKREKWFEVLDGWTNKGSMMR